MKTSKESKDGVILVNKDESSFFPFRANLELSRSHAPDRRSSIKNISLFFTFHLTGGENRTNQRSCYYLENKHIRKKKHTAKESSPKKPTQICVKCKGWRP